MAQARVFVIVVAAGSGSRIGGDEPKAFLRIGGRAIVRVAVEAAAAGVAVAGIVVVAPPGSEDRMRDTLAAVVPEPVVVAGGPTRQASVLRGLGRIPEDADLVVVHDAARPFAPPELFRRVVEAVEAGADASLPALPLADTIKRVRDGLVVVTEARDELASAQTPQAFRAGALRAAHERALAEGWRVTDDAALLERSGAVVRVVPGDPANFKITTELDLARADRILEGRVG